MKNIFRFLMAVAVLFTASCAKEDISSSIGGGEVEVTFTANLPELGTRAYADGTKATALRYFVYDGDTYLQDLSSEALLEKKVTLSGGKATVTLTLLKGMTYNIVFWADNGGEFYSYDTASKTITVDYTGAKANDDNRDAFYKYLPAVDPATATAEQTNIVLTRPFAQLNAATNDFETVDKSGVTLTESTVKVTTFRTLDLTNGQPGTPAEVTFDATAMPCMLTTGEEILMANYKYLSMNYLLPGTVDAEFTFKGTRNNGSEIVFTGTKYSAVPLKANYRTNILGALLTKPTEFNVTINPVFTDPAEEILVKPWDGTTEAVTPDANNVYSISNANQLAWIAEQVNAGNDFAGKTINLTNDIDLNNIPWTPIGLGELDPQFKGTLDGAKATRSGDCYVIRNLYVAPTKGEYTAAGLFGRLNGCVKNLVIDGAYIEHVTSAGPNGTTNGIAIVAGSTYNTSVETSVENVTVKNAVVKGNRYAAGIVGYADGVVKNCTVEDSQIILSCDNLTGSWDNGDKGGSIVGYANSNFEELSGCVAQNVTITGYRDLGGIIGYARGTISGNTVEGVKLVVDNTHNYKNYTAAAQYDLGSYYGEKDGAAVVENNTGEAEVVIEAIGLTWEQQAAVENATVTLPAQAEPYVLPATIADGVTFVGDGVNTVVNVSKAYGSSISNATNVSFKNLTIEKDNTLYVGFYSINTETYIGCTIKGALWTYGNAYFEDCDFIQEDNEYNVRIYGEGNVKFKKCDFNCANKSILIYSEGAKEYNVAIDDCTFVSSNPSTDKAAVQMHTEYGITGVVKINNCTATDFNAINNGLWNELNNQTGVLTNVFEKWVNGVQVYNDYTVSNGAYNIYTAAGLVALSAQTIKGNESITLAANIDLTGVEFNGLSAFNSENSNTFDGNGYTISNWTNNSGASDMGFFKRWVGTIKNVKFDNCHLKTNGRSAIVAGNTYANIENVHLTNCSIEDSHWACGALAGLYNSGSVKNCSVENVSVKSNGGVGALIGVVNESANARNFEDCVVKNCNLTWSKAYGDAYGAGALVGMYNLDGTTTSLIKNCEVTGFKLNGVESDAIYGATNGTIVTVE